MKNYIVQACDDVKVHYEINVIKDAVMELSYTIGSLALQLVFSFHFIHLCKMKIVGFAISCTWR